MTFVSVLPVLPHPPLVVKLFCESHAQSFAKHLTCESLMYEPPAKVTWIRFTCVVNVSTTWSNGTSLPGGAWESDIRSRMLFDLLQQQPLIRLAKFDGPDTVTVVQRHWGAPVLLQRIEERFEPRSNFTNDWVVVQWMMETVIHFHQSDTSEPLAEESWKSVKRGCRSLKNSKRRTRNLELLQTTHSVM